MQISVKQCSKTVPVSVTYYPHTFKVSLAINLQDFSCVFVLRDVYNNLKCLFHNYLKLWIFCYCLQQLKVLNSYLFELVDFCVFVKQQLKMLIFLLICNCRCVCYCLQQFEMLITYLFLFVCTFVVYKCLIRTYLYLCIFLLLFTAI